MLLIDHQVGTMAWTHSHDINLVKQNALKLARIGKAAGIPIVLTASMEDQVQGPLLPELQAILPEEFEARIKRPGIVNAMHHEGFNKAVKATGRKKLFVAGVTTEICITFPVLQMLDEGYEVQVSADASASYTKYGDDISLRRMEQAGAIITTVDIIDALLQRDRFTVGGKNAADARCAGLGLRSWGRSCAHKPAPPPSVLKPSHRPNPRRLRCIWIRTAPPRRAS